MVQLKPYVPDAPGRRASGRRLVRGGVSGCPPRRATSPDRRLQLHAECSNEPRPGGPAGPSKATGSIQFGLNGRPYRSAALTFGAGRRDVDRTVIIGGVGHRLLLAALTVLLSAGCVSPSMPAGPEPSGPAPEPVPSGVLYGRVLRPDGRPATQSTVQAYQVSGEDDLRTGIAMMSLGFFCLLPGFCPSPVSAKVDQNGRYAYPANKIKPVKRVTITARHAADAGQVSGPEVVISFDHQDGTQQRVPDLRYWEPAVSVRQIGSQAAVSWPALASNADYALWTITDGGRSGRPQPTGVATRGTSANIDLRPYEDKPTALIVVATVEKDKATFAYHSGSVALPTAGAPPSRGLPCKIGDSGAPLLEAAAPCPLTDGNLEDNAAVPTPCPSSTTASACPNPTRHRICVDLGSPQPVSLLVYRTPFLASGTIVELSSDGRHFKTVGRSADSDDSDVHLAHVAPAVVARLACVRNDRFGFGGAVLNEISVWTKG